MKKLLLLLALILTFTSASLNAKEVSLEAKITGLYVAFFDRAADQTGLTYWTGLGETAREEGEDVSAVLKDLSAAFATHPVFTTTYKDMDNREFVEAIYRNVLGREGDAEGVAFWTEMINNGTSRSDMVASFVEASLKWEDPGTLNPDVAAAAQLRKDLITNKVTVALAFTNQLGKLSNIINSDDPANDPAYLASSRIISEVTEDRATVTDAIGFLGSVRESSDPIGDINSASTIVTIRIGVFLDSVVEGVKYKTSSGLVGFTNDKGEYKFRESDTVEFLVGDILLGNIKADKLITVLNLENPAQVAMLLQSLDSDRNPENGINIAEDMFLLLENSSIDITTASPDNQEFLDKFKNITLTDFKVDKANALEHARISMTLENLKAMNSNLYNYYIGDINIYNRNNMNKELLKEKSSRRLNLYNYHYIVVPELDLMSAASKKKIDKHFNVHNQAEIFITASSIAMAELIAIVDKKPEDVAKHLKERGLEYGKEKLLDVGKSIIDQEYPNLPIVLREALFRELKLVYGCADVFGKPSPVNITNCVSTLTFEFANIINDGGTAWELYSSAEYLNTLTLAREYLSEYFNAGGDYNFIYDRYSVDNEEDFIAKLKASTLVTSNTFWTAGDYLIDDALFVELVEKYKSTVIKKTNHMIQNYGLKANLDALDNVVVIPEITKGKYNVETKEFSICYKIENNSYHFVDDLELNIRIEDESTVVVAKDYHLPSMYTKSSSDEVCLNVPFDADENSNFNNNYFITTVAINFNIDGQNKTSTTSKVIYLSENNLFDILKKVSPPTIVIEKFSSKVKDNNIYPVNVCESYIDSSQGVLEFQWEQVDINGFEINIEDSDRCNPLIVIPSLPNGIEQKTILLAVSARASISKSETIKTFEVTVDSDAETIIDNELPVAYAGEDIEINVNETVQFQGENSNPDYYDYDLDDTTIDWIWKDGQGEVASYKQNFTKQFIKPGIYTFSLTVNDDSYYNWTFKSHDNVTVTVIGGAETVEKKSVSAPTATAPKDTCFSFVNPVEGCEAAVQKGTSYTKTWTFENTGNVDLSNVRAVLDISDPEITTSVHTEMTPTISAGDTGSFSISMTIPETASEGIHKGRYYLADADGSLHYANGNIASFWYMIDVKAPAISTIPQNFKAEQKVNGVLLSWSAVDGASEYTPYYSLDGVDYLPMNGSHEHDYSQTSYLFPYTDITTVYFKIQADNGELSEALEFIWEEPVVINIPTNLRVVLTTDGVRLIWDAVIDAQSYTVMKSLNGTLFGDYSEHSGITTSSYFFDASEFSEGEILYFSVAIEGGEQSEKVTTIWSSTTPPFEMPEEEETFDDEGRLLTYIYVYSDYYRKGNSTYYSSGRTKTNIYIDYYADGSWHKHTENHNEDDTVSTYEWEKSDGYYRNGSHIFRSSGSTKTQISIDHFTDGSWYKNTRNYNEDVLVTSVECEYSNGSYGNISYTYYSNDILKTMISIDYYADGSWYTYTWNYDEDGRRTTSEWEKSDGSYTNTSNTYSNGVIKTAITISYATDGSWYAYTFNYDEDGMITTFEWENSNGSYGDNSYTYDSNGNLKTAIRTHYEPDGSWYKNTQYYDEDGNLIDEEYEEG